MRKRTSRRVFLTLPILGASTAAYARFVEPAWLQFTRCECPIPNLRQSIELIHLSDFHASAAVPKSLIERAIEMAIESKPDLICLTGDFVTSAAGFDAGWYTTVLRRLALKAPTFAVLGNHDGGAWSASAGGFRTTAEVARMVEESGICLLTNRSRKITCHGAELQLVGLGDLWAREFDAVEAFQQTDPKCPTVVLSHNPDSKDELDAYQWNLMLSGHTHGGQVVVPVIGLNPAPVVDRRYIAGLKGWMDRWIHVSRGVGNVGGVRFNCRPEVSGIRLIPPTNP
jgi:predicted MPP superfamily phosphohydrolase